MDKKNFDSEFCGSLPLHLINHIQPYGVLIVLDKDFKLIQVSENIQNVTGLDPRNAVNRLLTDFVPEEQFKKLKESFKITSKGKLHLKLSFTINNNSYNFLTSIQSKQEYFLLEMEEADKAGRGGLFADVYQEVKYAMTEISAADSVDDVCNIAIRELKRLSGFDKLMVYQFDEDWNGKVIAECMEEGMESYLGLHFPASDIPKQARMLYLNNSYRLIPTRAYTPVKIFPVINPITNGFIDLSNCNVRSVPAVHLEYMSNMKIEASMSTAIIKDEVLWGLISCHHRQEKYLDYEMCSVFELMAGFISSRVSALNNKENFENLSRLQQIKAKLIEQIYLEDDVVAGLTQYDTNVLQLLDCSGAVIIYNKKMQVVGDVPDRYEIKDLVLWLQDKSTDKLFSTTCLSELYDYAAPYTSIASGLIALPIHAEKGEYIIGFRPEVIQTVNWGGNPEEAINFEKNNITYHPRNSFQLWKQTLQHRSLPWQPNELDVAESFRNFLIEYTLKKVYSLM